MPSYAAVARRNSREDNRSRPAGIIRGDATGDDADVRLAGGRKGSADVGDTPAYLFRDGEVKEGKIHRDEAFGHPYRNQVLQALGSRHPVSVDTVDRGKRRSLGR